MIGAMFTLLSVGGYAISTLTGVLWRATRCWTMGSIGTWTRFWETLTVHVVVAGPSRSAAASAAQLRRGAARWSCSSWTQWAPRPTWAI